MDDATRNLLGEFSEGSRLWVAKVSEHITAALDALSEANDRELQAADRTPMMTTLSGWSVCGSHESTFGQQSYG